jgi:hypothetical protein
MAPTLALASKEEIYKHAAHSKHFINLRYLQYPRDVCLMQHKRSRVFRGAREWDRVQGPRRGKPGDL